MSHTSVSSISSRRLTRMAPAVRLYSTKLSFITIVVTLLIATSFLATQSTHLQALASESVDSLTTTTSDQHRLHTSSADQQAPAAPSSYLNYLLYNSKRQQQQQQQQSALASGEQLKLERLLKDTNHSHVSDTVDLQLANSIWKQMRQNALNYARDSAQQARPSINQMLDKSRVGKQCKQALNDILDHLASLDQWAVEMYNSFGEFPATGFFEGSLTSMGSYHQCVNVKDNEWIGAPQYCTFKFQPIVPKRPKFHNILTEIDNLANFTSTSDMFRGLAKKAQYFYYIKLRLATCMPSKCDQADMDLLGEQIAINTYLQYQGSECLQRAVSFNPDGAQIFAIIVLISLASISVLGTLVHMFNLKALFEARSALGNVAVDLTTSTKKNTLHHSVVLGANVNFNNNVTTLNNSAHNHIEQQQQQHQDQHEEQIKKIGPNNNLVANNNNNNNNNSNHLNHHHHQHHLANTKSAPLLPLTIQSSPSVFIDSSKSTKIKSKRNRSSASGSYIIRAINFLMHFSILKNGRKLFDTSTSRRGSTSNIVGGNSLVPSMQIGSSSAKGCGGSSSSSTTSSSSQSDTSSLEGQANDISCVHGLRFWTISWIILGHTMQYTEWAGFGRAYQVEQNITSFLLHPFLNATFSVDTFFLISGLLTTYVTWSITRGQYWRFNKFAFLISRYLRLMPQVLIVILIFIIFPLFGDGPYWRGMIQKESDRCKQNWWVSALFLQSFYRSDQICNLVTWWLSVEMFYHFTSIIVIIALLHSARKGILAALIVGGGLTGVSCYLHFVNHYPPNMLPTLLQRYEIWDSIVLKYFWTPYPHAPSYFTGLLLGYALYNRSINQLTRKQIRYGWTAFIVCYLTILFGTYQWNNGASYSRFASSAYYNLSQIFWSLATGWAILACALGAGGWFNDFLSSPVFIPLGRATYMTYLSHMLIVMSYPAKMNLLIEPSYIVFLYIFISNLFLSYALGIFLTLVYESPILHLQKLLVSRMATRFNDDVAPRKNRKNSSDGENSVKVSLYTQEQQQQQQQQLQQLNQVPSAIVNDNCLGA